MVKELEICVNTAKKEKHNLCLFSDDGVEPEPYDDFKDVYENRDYFDGYWYDCFEEEFEKQGVDKNVHISDVAGGDTRMHNLLKALS